MGSLEFTKRRARASCDLMASCVSPVLGVIPDKPLDLSLLMNRWITKLVSWKPPNIWLKAAR